MMLAETLAPAAPSAKVRQVLDAARMLFMAHGFGATSMDAIAREAGVSKATLYAHFESKDELFAEIIGTECRRYAETVGVLDETSDPPAVTLYRIACGFLRFVYGPKPVAVHRIVLGEAARFPQLGRIFYESGPCLVRQTMAKYLARLDQEKKLSIPDPMLAAEQFFGMLKGDTYMRRTLELTDGLDEAEVTRMAEAAVGLFVRGYARRE